MFASLTNDELITLAQMIHRGRDRAWHVHGSHITYPIVPELAGIMADLHAENQTR